MEAINYDKLRAPFPASDIEWRVQQSGVKNGKGWAMVLAYVTNRAIQQRLDDVVGPENWRNEFSKAPDDGVLCGIGIRVKAIKLPTNSEWITKYDGAENTQVEAVKGGLSGAMKRAAVQWGIGRYLYNLETKFVQVVEKGENRITCQNKDSNGKPIGEAVKGYWNAPTLPDWALPTPEPVATPKPPEKPVEPLAAAPAIEGVYVKAPPTINSEQITELMQLAKMKGYTLKKEAAAFLDMQTQLFSFTLTPASEFEAFKKKIISSGWKAGEGQDH